MPLEPNYAVRERHEFVVEPRVAGRRLDAYLSKRFRDHSRTCLAGLVDAGDVTVDGSRVKPSHRTRAGERIVVSLPLLEKPHLEPDDVPLAVLFEDEWLLAIDKSPGMVVHPSRGHQRGTMVNALIARFGKLSEVRSELRPGVLHRLDRDTSGVILFAKEDEAHAGLARQFEKREVEKTYLAIVKGQPGMDEFEVNLPLGPHPKNRLKIAVRPEGGSPARTRFRTLERYRRFALVEARPATGRTHQIRVHLLSFGHPVAADPLYSGAEAIFPSDVRGVRKREGDEAIVERTQLHAARIEFVHPMTGTEMAVESPLPADMRRFLDLLARDREGR